MSELLYHIAEREAWQQAIRAGRYRAASLVHEGFIHCSFRHQVERVAANYYAGRSDLLLLEIDPDALEAEVLLEGGAELFPHIYGSIQLAAVTRITPFEPSSGGSFAFPSDFA
jgi:uncharacterized protein (DUF952 family)